jgi:hypothetical protein
VSVRTVRPFVRHAGPAGGDMNLYADAGVDASVAMMLHMRTPSDEYVSILFGDDRLTLEFYDVESLERLRDLAAEGAQLLRVALALAETG